MLLKLQYFLKRVKIILPKIVGEGLRVYISCQISGRWAILYNFCIDQINYFIYLFYQTVLIFVTINDICLQNY